MVAALGLVLFKLTDSTASRETFTERTLCRRSVWGCALFGLTLRECLSEAADLFTVMAAASFRSTPTLRIYQVETRNRRANQAPRAKSNCYPRRGIVVPKQVLPNGLGCLVSCCLRYQGILTVNPTFRRGGGAER